MLYPLTTSNFYSYIDVELKRGISDFNSPSFGSFRNTSWCSVEDLDATLYISIFFLLSKVQITLVKPLKRGEGGIDDLTGFETSSSKFEQENKQWRT